MPLPATLPPWIQGGNPGMFGRGLQLGEDMRANRAAEQFKQQEMMRQRQQDALAQQNHQEEVQRQKQQDAVREEQWKAEFGLQKQQNQERIDAAAKKFAAQQGYAAAVQAANGDPRKIQEALAKYGPAMGVNPGPLIAAQERSRSAEVERKNRAAISLHNSMMRMDEARKKEADKKNKPALSEKDRMVMSDRLSQTLEKFKQDNEQLLGEIPKDANAMRKKAMQDAQAYVKRLEARISELDTGEKAPSEAEPAAAPSNVRRYDVNGNPVGSPKMTGANAPAMTAPPQAAPAKPVISKPPPQATVPLPPTLPRLGANAPASAMLPQQSTGKAAVLQKVLALPDSELANASKTFGVQASVIGDGRFFVGDPSTGKEYSKDDFVNLLTQRAKEQTQPQQAPSPATLPFQMLSAPSQ